MNNIKLRFTIQCRLYSLTDFHPTVNSFFKGDEINVEIIGHDSEAYIGIFNENHFRFPRDLVEIVPQV
jgi:hypothetical protein